MGAKSPEGKIEYTPEHKEVKQSGGSSRSGKSQTQQTVEKTRAEIAKALS